MPFRDFYAILLDDIFQKAQDLNVRSTNKTGFKIFKKKLLKARCFFGQAVLRKLPRL